MATSAAQDRFTDVCQCEHVDHFEGDAHPYGHECDADEMTLISTPHGFFRVCMTCRREHLTDDIIGG